MEQQLTSTSRGKILLMLYAFEIPANGSIDEMGVDERDLMTDSPDGNSGSDVDSDASPPV